MKLSTLVKSQSLLLRKLAVTLMATGALCATSATVAQTYTMKLSTPTINDLQHQWANMYKEALEKNTGGRIKVQVFPASQLGPIASVLEGMQLGSIEATLTPYEFYTGIDRRYQVPGMPGLFSSMQDAYNKLNAPKVREQLMNLGTAKGIVGLSTIIYGPQIFISRQPIKALSDFERKKVRVLASDIEINAVKALGSAAVPMPLPEVATGLQQGAIDAANNLYDVVVPQKMYSFAPNVVETDLWYVVVHASVSAKWLKQLPPDLQAAVIDTAKALEPVIFKHQLERQAKTKEAWLANKGQSTKLSAADQAQAEAKVLEVTNTFLAQNPALKETYELVKTATNP